MLPAASEWDSAGLKIVENATLPVFDLVLADSEDNLWVQDHRRPYQSGPRWWTVFDPEGRALGRIQTPKGLHVFQIGADFILGRNTDELDVEYVEIWGLGRAPQSPIQTNAHP